MTRHLSLAQIGKKRLLELLHRHRELVRGFAQYGHSIKGKPRAVRGSC